MMILVYVFSESPFQAAGLKLSGLSSESDGESVFQITMQVSDLSFGSLYVEAVSLTGHLTVVTGYFTVCLFYDESIGQHGFADAFEQFMHVIVWVLTVCQSLVMLTYCSPMTNSRVSYSSG